MHEREKDAALDAAAVGWAGATLAEYEQAEAVRERLVPYRTWRAQKAGLTRAVKSGDRDAIARECRRVVEFDWTEGSPHTPYWPDDWRRWRRALEDAGGHALADAIFGGAS